MLFEVGHEIVQRFGVGVHALLLGIGHENNAVYAAQNKFAAGIIKDLAGNSIEVDSGLEAANRAEIKRKEIKEQSALGFSGERDHLVLLLLGSGLVNVLQVGGLAAQARAIVHDFAVDLAGCEVDKTQDSPQRADVSASKRSAGGWVVLWFLYHMARFPLGLPALLVRRASGFGLQASVSCSISALCDGPGRRLKPKPKA